MATHANNFAKYIEVLRIQPLTPELRRRLLKKEWEKISDVAILSWTETGFPVMQNKRTGTTPFNDFPHYVELLRSLNIDAHERIRLLKKEWGRFSNVSIVSWTDHGMPVMSNE